MTTPIAIDQVDEKDLVARPTDSAPARGSRPFEGHAEGRANKTSDWIGVHDAALAGLAHVGVFSSHALVMAPLGDQVPDEGAQDKGSDGSTLVSSSASKPSTQQSSTDGEGEGDEVGAHGSDLGGVSIAKTRDFAVACLAQLDERLAQLETRVPVGNAFQFADRGLPSVASFGDLRQTQTAGLKVGDE